MYEQFFRFTEKPFGLTPDPRFLYASASHVTALERLHGAIARRECFAVVEGDVGTGKTTLCRALVEQADRKTLVALLKDAPASPEELIAGVLKQFGVATLSDDPAAQARPGLQEMVNTLEDFLLALPPLGAAAVLVIDEAQSLPIPVLEQIRRLLNLPAQKETLLQAVLVGRGMQAVLQTSELRRLDQHLSLRIELQPMSREETGAYIAHRLAAAGGAGVLTLTPSALQAIHRYARGVPRLVNMLCHRALIGAQAAQTHEIDPRLVAAAADQLDLKGGESASSRPWWSRLVARGTE